MTHREATTLIAMIVAAVVGAWLGAGMVARAPRRFIQLGMGVALLVAAALMLAKNLAWLPPGGEALGLHGPTLVFAVCANCLLGALMMLGVGLYAPCLILVSLLGMSPLVAFPIMMGSCALLMPVGGARFVRTRRYNPGAALGLTLGGIPGVLCAAFIVRSLPLGWLRWLVVIVVMYAAALMLVSGRK
ncbi:MAG TPA: sulfite exporter TauE/SafE family protein [Steroidobacteraceae bacterium]|nr:sulfite exporter TauE/SafE family protein [Steroidobacteraceae bacterium]